MKYTQETALGKMMLARIEAGSKEWAATRGDDSDDLALALGSLLRLARFDVRIVLVRQARMPNIHHVFVQARRPGDKKWISFDPHEGTAYAEQIIVEERA